MLGCKYVTACNPEFWMLTLASSSFWRAISICLCCTEARYCSWFFWIRWCWTMGNGGTKGDRSSSWRSSTEISTSDKNKVWYGRAHWGKPVSNSYHTFRLDVAMGISLRFDIILWNISIRYLIKGHPRVLAHSPKNWWQGLNNALRVDCSHDTMPYWYNIIDTYKVSTMITVHIDVYVITRS